jgi:hypothetical protein
MKCVQPVEEMNENYLREKMRRALANSSQPPRCASLFTTAFNAHTKQESNPTASTAERVLANHSSKVRQLVLYDASYCCYGFVVCIEERPSCEVDEASVSTDRGQ